MNLLLLKQLAILGGIVGGGMGLAALLSPLTLGMIILSFGLPAIIVLVYMKSNDLIGIMNIREGAIFGAIIGAVSFMAGFIVFAPVSLILSFIYSTLFKATYLSGFLRLISFDFVSLFSLFLCILFLAGLSALFNGFFGAVTAWGYEMITGLKKEDNENNSIDFEIK